MLSHLLSASLLLYFASGVGYAREIARASASGREPGPAGRAAAWLLAAGFLANAAAIAVMSARAGRLPFSNTFETLVLFSAFLAAGGWLYERRARLTAAGAVGALFALLFAGYAHLQGKTELKPLIPALKSNWLLAHVLSYFVAYAVASFSFGLGVLGLLRDESGGSGARAARGFGAASAGLVAGAVGYMAIHKAMILAGFLRPMSSVLERFRVPVDPVALAMAVATAYIAAVALYRYRAAWAHRLPALERLDEGVDQSIRFSFPFLTLGLVTGAVWANETWGSYWSWDPKETWALVTWLVYAAYLHARIVHGLRGRATRVLAVAAYHVVIFTYFGVNYLLAGLHSYA